MNFLRLKGEIFKFALNKIRFAIFVTSGLFGKMMSGIRRGCRRDIRMVF